MYVLTAGFPYIRKNYFDTFQFYPEKDKIFFLLPRQWKVQGGKAVYYPPEQLNVFKTKTFFHHSRYPIIGGLLKGWMPVFPVKLLGIIKNRKIDIVYNCNEPVLLTTLYFGIWSKIFGLKNILFSWENIPYYKKFRGASGFIKNIILKLNLKLSDGIICGNNKGAEIFKALTKKPIAVIPMSGLDADFFKPQAKAKEFAGVNLEEKVIFSFVGAIGFRKGIHIAINAFKDALKEVPNAYFIIAGSGEYEREIDKLIDELNLERYIKRVPWLSHHDVRDLLSVSDVFLYPSIPYKGWEEQFGNSMAEASLIELPVISTKSGSIEDVVIDGKTGILVSPGSQRELSDAMIKLAKDKKLKEELGKNGREHIARNFSYEVIANKFYKFFSEIIAS